jgi:hypothetical protein
MRDLISIEYIVFKELEDHLSMDLVKEIKSKLDPIFKELGLSSYGSIVLKTGEQILEEFDNDKET